MQAPDQWHEFESLHFAEFTYKFMYGIGEFCNLLVLASVALSFSTQDQSAIYINGDDAIQLSHFSSNPCLKPAIGWCPDPGS